VEADGSIPNLPKILKTGELYRAQYAQAQANIARPMADRPPGLRDAWYETMNGLVAVINMRTRVRSMYIADASASNNEMTKIIRMAWSMREILGRDRRQLAEFIIARRKLTS